MRSISTIILVLAICSFASAHKTDSVGTKAKNGFIFIEHKVEKGEGLYSISKKYNVPLKDIVAQNPGSDEVVKLDQILLIPTGAKANTDDMVVNDFFTSKGAIKDIPVAVKSAEIKEVTTFAKYHKVVAGETLYSISKKYNTSVEMIKTLNALDSDELSEGQRVLVQDGAAKTVVVSSEDDVEMDYAKMKEAIDEEGYSDVGFESNVETKSVESSAGYTRKIEKLVEYNIEKIEETGTILIGGDKVPSDKNFASHFSAPIGTVIMVTNPETKKTVFVKVVSNFTMDEGSSTIIRLSDSSAQQIGVKSKSPIQLSYAR